jgi:hypothetical protein
MGASPVERYDGIFLGGRHRVTSVRTFVELHTLVRDPEVMKLLNMP